MKEMNTIYLYSTNLCLYLPSLWMFACLAFVTKGASHGIRGTEPQGPYLVAFFLTSSDQPALSAFICPSFHLRAWNPQQSHCPHPTPTSNHSTLDKKNWVKWPFCPFT